jgi:hypothetical protein
LAEFEAGGEGFGLGVEQGFDGVEVTRLEFDVSRDGDGAEAVVAVGKAGGFAEFLGRVGRPAADLGDVGGEGVGGGEDLVLEVTLGDESGDLSLPAAGLGVIDGRAAAASDGNGQGEAEADGGLVAIGGFARVERADAERGVAFVLGESNGEALLFEFGAADAVVEIIFASGGKEGVGGRGRSESERGGGDQQRGLG